MGADPIELSAMGSGAGGLQGHPLNLAGSDYGSGGASRQGSPERLGRGSLERAGRGSLEMGQGSVGVCSAWEGGA